MQQHPWYDAHLHIYGCMNTSFLGRKDSKMAGSINGQNHLIPQAEKATSVLASSTEQ